MPKRTAPPDPRKKPELNVSRVDAKSKLEDRVSKGKELVQRHLQAPADLERLIDDQQTWTEYNTELLRGLFSTDEIATGYDRCNPPPSVYFGAPTMAQQVAGEREIINAELRFLGSIIERLDLYPVASGSRNADVGTASATVPRTPLDVLEQLANRFHLVAQQLRSRHGGRETLKINDEYDVQDLLHGLLLLEFDDVRPEEHTPSYAGGSTRMDFLLKNEQIVVEVKCTRDGLGSREVGEQLLVDIAKYRSHQDCKSLFCFVYDPAGRLNNPRGLESDLSHARHGLPTRVRIRPRFS
jgi:hypothetical protein